MMRALRWASFLACAVALAGCNGHLFDVNLFVVGQQTALERQVLGAYGTLGTDLQSYSSVRGIEPDGSIATRPPMTESQAAVLRAMRNRQYNRDDLDLLLASGVLGEGRDGMLAQRSTPTAPIQRITPELATRILTEENGDRRAILDRLMTTVPGVKPEESDEVAWIFATLNQQSAPKGSPIQDRAGAWVSK